MAYLKARAKIVTPLDSFVFPCCIQLYFMPLCFSGTGKSYVLRKVLLNKYSLRIADHRFSIAMLESCRRVTAMLSVIIMTLVCFHFVGQRQVPFRFLDIVYDLICYMTKVQSLFHDRYKHFSKKQHERSFFKLRTFSKNDHTSFFFILPLIILVFIHLS